jgi:hypothetical protein
VVAFINYTPLIELGLPIYKIQQTQTSTKIVPYTLTPDFSCGIMALVSGVKDLSLLSLKAVFLNTGHPGDLFNLWPVVSLSERCLILTV